MATVVVGEAPLGHTHYLDQFAPGDMPGAVSKGRDRFGREFLALRFRYAHPSDPHRTGEHVECLFQRYSNDVRVWTSGGGNFLCTAACTWEDVAFVGRLLRGEKVGRRVYVYNKEDVPTGASNLLYDESRDVWTCEVGQLELF